MKSIISALVIGFAAIIPARSMGTNSAATVSARSTLTMGGLRAASVSKASPLFVGDQLPVPPEQNTAWISPATDLPTNYISATRILFEQGMADPRGGDYRVIEVGTGNVWTGDGGVVTTHGWVLPGDVAQKFAVAWNGMVYPVVSVGTNADLAADVSLLETNDMSRGWYGALPEAASVSQNSRLGIKGCLLLRLGQADWASRLWLAQQRAGIDFQNQMQRRFSSTNALTTTNEIKLPGSDPYQIWATEWAWAMFNRTICAHERGDEKLALFTARQLAVAQPQIEAECAVRGFKRQPYWDSDHRGQQQPYLTFLSQFPELLTDLERREKEGVHVSIITTGITNVTDPTKRIAALIHDLDLVQARQWGQPGGVDLAQDATVSALINEGDAAVEPLLDCLEHDSRLTCSVRFGRDFGTDRTVLSVKQAALVALQSILQGRFSNAPEIRAYWNKYKNLTLEERWYAILNDDTARSRWLEAAADIVQPENLSRFPGGFNVRKPAPTNAPVKLRGEILRSKTNPTLTELLTRHALEVPTNNFNQYNISTSCQFAEDLARWDAAAALPVVKRLVKRACTVMQYSDQKLGSAVAKLSIVCANDGDPEAFTDYAGWIVTTTPERLDYSLTDCLEPFLKFPANPVLQTAAMKLFGDTNSAWANLPWKSNYGFNPIESGLVKIPAFRLLLVRELERTNVCGTFIWNQPGQISYEITNYQSGGYGVAFPSGTQPATVTTNELRWCDWVACQLSNAKAIPFYNPFASTANRNAAIEQAKIQLKKP